MGKSERRLPSLASGPAVDLGAMQRELVEAKRRYKSAIKALQRAQDEVGVANVRLKDAGQLLRAAASSLTSEG